MIVAFILGALIGACGVYLLLCYYLIGFGDE
jgi:hypothetical protein